MNILFSKSSIPFHLFFVASPGILEILNELNPKLSGAPTKTSESELETAKAALDSAQLAIVFEEIEYDEKCLDVYFQKASSYEVRVRNRYEEWQAKRTERAKLAVSQYWEQKVSWLIHI